MESRQRTAGQRVDASPDSGETSSGRDERHLRTLAVMHYLVAAVTVCFAATGVSRVDTGRSLMRDKNAELPDVLLEAEKIVGRQPTLHDPENQPIVGAIWLMIGAFLITLSLVHGCALAYIGRCIARRRRRTLCIAFSIFDLTYCLPLPLGTALSIYALAILLRPSVKEKFMGAAS